MATSSNNKSKLVELIDDLLMMLNENEVMIDMSSITWFGSGYLKKYLTGSYSESRFKDDYFMSKQQVQAVRKGEMIPLSQLVKLSADNYACVCGACSDVSHEYPYSNAVVWLCPQDVKDAMMRYWSKRKMTAEL